MPLTAFPKFQSQYVVAAGEKNKTPYLKSAEDTPPTPPLSQTYQHCSQSPPFISMAQQLTTTTKKRPRCTPKPKPKNEGILTTTVDIEDINFNDQQTQQIRASLLNWYDQNQRDLPWRRISNTHNTDNDKSSCSGVDTEDESETTAYAVWVSEVMLQQTRVQTVIDYFNRWMLKWPTLHHLAHASLEEVNEMWAGLGYYRRARFLLEGAKMIAQEGGKFPRTVSDLRKVRGIGDYTAGAIASIAFKEAVPVVDGNVVRVIARLKAISANPKENVTVKNFWKLAGQLVDSCRPGDFNQALMELGATICTPLSPSCSACPVSGQCNALSVSKQKKSVLVTDYPIKVVKAKQRHDFSAVSVVEILKGQDRGEGSHFGGIFLLVKRPEGGLLAGLWEFPSVLMERESDLTTRREAIDRLLKHSFNLDLNKSCNVVLREHVGEYVHVFTHIRLKMHVELLVLRLKGGKNVLQGKQGKEPMAWKYVDDEALSSMGLTSGVRKVYTMIQKFKQNCSNPIPAKTRKNGTPRN